MGLPPLPCTHFHSSSYENPLQSIPVTATRPSFRDRNAPNSLNRSRSPLEDLVKWHKTFQDFRHRECLGRLRPFDDEFVHVALQRRGL